MNLNIGTDVLPANPNVKIQSLKMFGIAAQLLGNDAPYSGKFSVETYTQGLHLGIQRNGQETNITHRY